MSSKQIITRLIDEHLISGEEAYTLMNDIIVGEIKRASDSLGSPYIRIPNITDASIRTTGVTYSGSSR